LDEQIAETQEPALQILLKKGFSKPEVENLWDLFSEDYFQRHQSDEVVWQTEGILNHQTDKPLIIIPEIDEDYDSQSSSVFVYTPDRPNLFAATVAAFHQLGLVIQDARIITSTNNFSLDTYQVLEEDGSAIGANSERIREIQYHLQNVLATPDSFPNMIRRRTPRQLRHFSKEPEVLISNQIEPRQTVIEIMATDRPGLLTLIGKTFADLELQVQGAKIGTFGEKVEDRFIVSDHNMTPIADEKISRKICTSLCNVLRKASKLDAITS
ncbi:MAG: [protein-PII] uridylyltransferase, partial [Endozoicomonas sp.]